VRGFIFIYVCRKEISLNEDLMLVLSTVFKHSDPEKFELYCAGGGLLDSLLLEQAPKDYDIFVISKSLSTTPNYLDDFINPLIESSNGMIKKAKTQVQLPGHTYDFLVVDCVLLGVYDIQFIFLDGVPRPWNRIRLVSNAISIDLSRAFLLNVTEFFTAIFRGEVAVPELTSGKNAKNLAQKQEKYKQKINLLKEKYNL
jgi:hypothetical protein